MDDDLKRILDGVDLDARDSTTTTVAALKLLAVVAQALKSTHHELIMIRQYLGKATEKKEE